MFDVYEVKGVLDGNEFAQVPAGTGLPKGKISINNAKFDVITEFAHSYLGQNVVAYTKYTENENTIIYVKPENNTITTVDAKYVSEYTVTQISYYPENSDKTKTLKISPFITTIVNNIAVNTDDGVAIPVYGDFILVDNNQDHVIDVVIISDIKILCVGSVDNKKLTVYNKYNTNESIELLDYDNYEIKDSNGKSLTINDIKQDMIIEVIQNDELTFISLKVCENKIDMNVAEKGSMKLGDNEYDYVTGNDGKQYVISPYFSSIMKTSTIKLGENYVFLIDSKNQIVVINKNYTDYLTVGYVIDFSNELKGLEKEFTLKIFTIDETFLTVKSADKVSLVGYGVISSQELLNILKVIEYIEMTGNQADWLVRFSLNKENKLNRIEFANSQKLTSGFRNAGSVFSKTIISNNIINRYKPGSRTIGGKILIDNNTKAINVPKKEDRDDESQYSVASSAYFIEDNYYPLAQAYTTLDNSIAAEYVVIPGITKSVGSDSPAMVFDSVSQSYDEIDDCVVSRVNGFVAGKKTGYNVKSGIQVGITTNGMTTPFKRGDVIQFVTNSKSQVTAFTLLFNAQKQEMTLVGKDAALASERRVTYGTPKYKIGDSLFIETTIPEDLDFIYTITNTYIYEFDGKEIKPISKNDIVTTNDNPANTTKVFTYLRYSEPRILVVYK